MNAENYNADTRSQFEDWARTTYTINRESNGQYCNVHTEDAWNAWQAALAARQPGGYSGIRSCGDERPCINCYSDQGDCLGPVPSQGSTRQPLMQEPAAWISRIRCVGPEYGKEIYGRLPVQSLNPLYYEHIPLYAAPPAQGIDLGGVQALIEKWEAMADKHGVRQFTGNDHRLFANELRVAIDQRDAGKGGKV